MKPDEHFITIDGLISKIEREVNWIGLDDHLDTAEFMELVNEISLSCHKARNKFAENLKKNLT